MTKRLLNEIKHADEFLNFRKKWNLDQIHERTNGFDASLISRTAKGWMEAALLTADPDDNEQDEEMRQEWVDYQLEQAEERLRITTRIQDCRYILPCETAIHTLQTENADEHIHYYTAIYSHESGNEVTPIGKHYTADSKETLKLAEHICRALVELHRLDALHKFICPENIFRMGDGTYCLGRAGIADDEENLRNSGFCPREKYDVRTDIYMLGQCLARVHQADDLSDKNVRRISAIIDRACEVEPSHRYQSAEEMLAALENRMDQKKIMLFAGIGGAAVLLILIGCILAAGLANRREPEKPQDSSMESVTETTAVTEADTTESESKTETETSTEPEKSESFGDPNNDGKINVYDAIKLFELSKNTQIDDESLKNCDVNGDGQINTSDCAILLHYSAYVATGGTESFTEFIADKED